MKRSPFQSDVLELDALMQEAESYRVAGQFEKSSNAYEQASGLLAGLGRDETQTAIVVLNNWGLAKQFLGRTLDAENLFRRAIAISTTNSAEESVSPMLLVNYSRVLRELGRLVEAAGYAERAHDKAQRAGDQMVVNQSLFVRASIYRQAGDLARSAEMVSELEPRLRRSLPAGHLAFASLGLEQAAIAQTRGDLESAFSQISRAVAMADASIEAGGGDGADYIPTLLLRRSAIELEMGRTDEAASDAARALQLVRRNASPGAFSSRVGLALLAVARARKAQGNRDEARAASHSAIEHLETTLGAAPPGCACRPAACRGSGFRAPVALLSASGVVFALPFPISCMAPVEIGCKNGEQYAHEQDLCSRGSRRLFGRRSSNRGRRRQAHASVGQQFWHSSHRENACDCEDEQSFLSKPRHKRPCVRDPPPYRLDHHAGSIREAIHRDRRRGSGVPHRRRIQ